MKKKAAEDAQKAAQDAIANQPKTRQEVPQEQQFVLQQLEQLYGALQQLGLNGLQVSLVKHVLWWLRLWLWGGEEKKNTDMNVVLFCSLYPQARKLMDFQKVVHTLTQVLAKGQADGNVCQLLGQIGQMIAGRDFNGALGLHRKLTQSSWDAHKEWLKPLKSGLDIAKRNIR